MTKKKEMRVKEVGATINLGQYSSLHVTLGEEQEYKGLDLQRSLNYLKRVADEVDGALNLPEKEAQERIATPPEASQPKVIGEKVYAFGGQTPIWYDNDTHSYYSEQGVRYDSVTQLLSTFYPFNSDGKIAQAYMDFAASYGNLVHTAVQNMVIGKPPKKGLVQDILTDVANAMGGYDNGWVEQLIAYPDQEIAGRFDILTKKDDKYTLWDVKTNSDLYIANECNLPDSLKEKFSEYWNPETIYGEHCLQLNLYAYIIEKTSDVEIGEIKIIHIPDGFKKVIDVPKVDVSAILQAYGSTR